MNMTEQIYLLYEQEVFKEIDNMICEEELVEIDEDMKTKLSKQMYQVIVKRDDTNKSVINLLNKTSLYLKEAINPVFTNPPGTDGANLNACIEFNSKKVDLQNQIKETLISLGERSDKILGFK